MAKKSKTKKPSMADRLADIRQRAENGEPFYVELFQGINNAEPWAAEWLNGEPEEECPWVSACEAELESFESNDPEPIVILVAEESETPLAAILLGGFCRRPMVGCQAWPPAFEVNAEGQKQCPVCKSADPHRRVDRAAGRSGARKVVRDFPEVHTLVNNRDRDGACLWCDRTGRDLNSTSFRARVRDWNSGRNRGTITISRDLAEKSGISV